MNRIRKKIEKRAAKLLIKENIFNQDDWDDLNLCFYSTDYYGECCEINAWDYLEDLVIQSTIEYTECDMDTGLWVEFGKIKNPSIIQIFSLFKRSCLGLNTNPH